MTISYNWLKEYIDIEEDPEALGKILTASESMQTNIRRRMLTNLETIDEIVAHATELDRIVGYEANYAGTSFLSPPEKFLGSFRYGPEFMNVVGEPIDVRGLEGKVVFDDFEDVYVMRADGTLKGDEEVTQTMLYQWLGRHDAYIDSWARGLAAYRLPVRIWSTPVEIRSMVAVDQRGIGASDKPKGGYDAGTLAKDLVALMDKLGHKRFAVVGHDTGYVISYALAADHPHRVDRLVVADLRSLSGTWLNDERLSAPQVVHEGDVVRVGCFHLSFARPGRAGPALAPPVSAAVATPSAAP